jgi:hypothetical protein
MYTDSSTHYAKTSVDLVHGCRSLIMCSADVVLHVLLTTTTCGPATNCFYHAKVANNLLLVRGKVGTSGRAHHTAVCSSEDNSRTSIRSSLH